MTAPASNATITTVTGPAGVDRYGDPSSASTLWSGAVNGYLKRPRMSRTGTDREEDIKTDTFVIWGEAASPVLQSLAAGADAEAVTVTIIDRRKPSTVSNTYRLKGLEILAAGTVADSVRLTLKREAPA
jgi:hypothetical protein